LVWLRYVGESLMRTEPNQIGCSVFDVDANTANPAQLAQLKELLYSNRIVVLKNQSVGDAQFCDFAHRFGYPEPYLQGNYHHPEYPLIFVSSNVKQGGKQVGVPRTGGYWHSDTAFEKQPKVITMLMPKVLPQTSPRSTRFIDMCAVYQALPEATKAQLEGAEFMHSGRWRYKVRAEDAGLDITEILELIDYHAPPVRHPAVLVHPYTGEKILYGTRGFTVGVADRSLDESAALLREIFDFAETPRFIREIRWSMGDLIIWDNRFLAHSSGRKKAPTDNIHEEVRKEEETMMYRITLRDEFPLCASQMPGRTAG
jgi:taurine dioxygenase